MSSRFGSFVISKHEPENLQHQYCPNRSHTNTGAQPGPETKQQIDAGVKHQAGAHTE
jgi:hypothetical protein